MGLLKTIQVGAKLLTKPWFNPLDPFGSILDEAIRRSPLRVVFWTPVFHCGGAEQWLASLCEHLDRKKIVPIAVCVQTKGEVNKEMAKRLTVPMIEGWEQLVPTANRADVVISWGLKELAEYAAGTPTPIVNVLHHPLEYVRKDLQKLLPGVRNVAVNPRMAADLGIDCVENGAEVARVFPLGDREAERARLGIAADERMVLYVGRLTREKNVPQIMEAVESLPGYKLLVCGPQQFRPSNWPKSDKVIYHPQIDHLGGVLAAADCLALPSSFESHGLALNEAWLAGLPTVSAAYSANLDFRERYGELSWLVPLPVEVDKLAEQIILACNGRWDLRVKRAKEVAEEFYTATAMAQRWETYLAGVRRDAIANTN